MIRQDETSKALNLRMKMPDTRVALQCMKQEFKTSANSGNMHVDSEWEVVDQPNTLVIDGQSIDLLGLELHTYTTTKWSDGKGGFKPNTDSAVKKGLGRAMEFYEKTGDRLEKAPDGVRMLDENNPPLLQTGVVVNAVLSSDEQTLLEKPTPEQIAKGQKNGSPKLDDNGKEVKIFRPKIAYILGLSDVKPQPF